jgi:EpsI family protein
MTLLPEDAKTRFLVKTVAAALCLLVTAGVIKANKPVFTRSKHQPLKTAMENIEGWTARPPIDLDPAIVKALALDDYLNRNYTRGEDTLALYIGYYYTSEKIGAAHDPLVCFPGQGWELSQQEIGAFTIPQASDTRVEYASMVAEIGGHKELIVYWFQAMDSTSPNTFWQKINLLRKKLFNQGGENAFVRISLPLKNGSVGETRQLIEEFVERFYPQFVAYVMAEY